MSAAKLLITINASILLWSACTSGRQPALPPLQSGASQPCEPVGRIHPSPPSPLSELQALSLRIQVDPPGRSFLFGTRQSIVIASADPSDEHTVVIRRAFDAVMEETTETFGPDWVLYLSPQSYAAFDIIEITYSSLSQAGQLYEFTGSQIVGAGAGVPDYISVYYDAPSNSTQPVTVGIATTRQGVTTPQPVSHYVLQRFETRLLPVPSPSVRVFVAGGVKSGEVIPCSILRPVGSVQASSRGSPPVQMFSGAPLFGNYLQVDLTAPAQSVIHFDSTINAFQYGHYPKE
jgi:hypothetical protein